MVQGMSNDTPSGFNPNQTIGQTAYDWASSVRDDLAAGEINDEYGYGFDVTTVISVTIAGGGPGADIAFEFNTDGDLTTATLNYYEMAGSASYRFDEAVAEELAEAFSARDMLSVLDDGQRAW